jgi:hypothetical protein
MIPPTLFTRYQVILLSGNVFVLHAMSSCDGPQLYY